MKIFVWRSEAFRDYTSGDIYALGVNVEDAREKISEHYKGQDRFEMIMDDIMSDDYTMVEVGHFWGSS